MKLYKVLVNGQSCHGGNFTWSLPQASSPGAWHEITQPLVKCSVGFHITASPAHWWTEGAECYECEAEGLLSETEDEDHKLVCSKIRLLKQLNDQELAELNVFRSGTHSISSGFAVASGSASVKAYGSSFVKAYGSSSVEAYGSSSVKAYDSASVKASGSSSVIACGSSSVKAYGSSSVEAYGSSSVKAWDSSSVEAWDSSSVEAYGSSSVKASDSSSVKASGSSSVEASGSSSVKAYNNVIVATKSGNPKVSVSHQAVWVDYTKSPPNIVKQF